MTYVLLNAYHTNLLSYYMYISWCGTALLIQYCQLLSLMISTNSQHIPIIVETLFNVLYRNAGSNPI